MVISTDRIEKKAHLRAPRSRVWRALATSEGFNGWFGVRMNGEFREGETIRGNITIPKYEHLTMDMSIVSIQPERYFAFQWHPYAIDPTKDYSAEPMTLVEFNLEEAEGGTLLTIAETGFDQIPEERRADAFRMNEGGWTGQLKNITAYLERHAG